MVQDLSYLCE